MKPRLSPKRNTAMTLFEVGVVIAIVVILAAFLLPTFGRKHAQAGRIVCINNLKQINLSYLVWAGDNGDILPMGISVTNGGSLEMIQVGNVVQTFMAMSNELSTPRILVCPSDDTHISATNFFTPLGNFNVSYFVPVDITNNANPQMLLSGDSNFQLGGRLVRPGLNSFWTNDPVSWTTNRHIASGNLGFADGSVQSTISASLQNYLQQTGYATNRLVTP
jgi:prepilin-type processing-associated H-X9-DG protein